MRELSVNESLARTMRALRSVRRYRERQHQLAAQKQNEAFLKYDYYQQIAKYFERECRIARHYDSWNYRGLDPKGELQKAKKAEKLLVRRNKLRTLLVEEEEGYKRELEERRNRNKRNEETSLEALKEKLKQKRAEQSLYYPKTCRRYRSYFVCPKDTIDPRWNTLKDTNLSCDRVCRDSTNLLRRNEPISRGRGCNMSDEHYKASYEQENQQTAAPIVPDYNENGKSISKYSARYARRSLENTNVRIEDSNADNRSMQKMQSGSSLSLRSDTERYSPANGENSTPIDDKKNSSHDSRSNKVDLDQSLTENRSSSLSDDAPKWARRVSREENIYEQDKDEQDHLKRPSTERMNDALSCDYTVEQQTAKLEQDAHRKDTRQFEVEKSLPWLRINPGDKNLSKQMFLYLTHKELKCKIEDLAKRESHACTKQYWDEALRLRDMRNKLELIREKKLYNMETLELDEESRKIGLVNIGKREAELAEREKVCMDSTMYSQDAKDLWKKWVTEDERSVIKDARQQREKLMNSLEKEWQNLAIRDKEKISRTYQTVMNDSTLQEEHKLAAAINASKMRSVSSS